MKRTSREGVWYKTRLGRKCDPQGIVQKTGFWTDYQIVYA